MRSGCCARGWLLALVPLAALAVLAIWRGGRGSGWERVMDAELYRVLAGARTAAGWPWRQLLPLAGAAVLAVALAGPAAERADAPALRNLDAAFLVVDVSPSVAKGRGLADLQAAAVQVLQGAEGRPMGLILYDGEAYLVSAPTLDPSTVETSIAVLDAGTMPGDGSRPDTALAMAAGRLAAAGIVGGDVVVISDGGGIGGETLAEARRIAQTGGTVSAIVVEVEPGLFPACRPPTQRRWSVWPRRGRARSPLRPMPARWCGICSPGAAGSRPTATSSRCSIRISGAGWSCWPWCRCCWRSGGRGPEMRVRLLILALLSAVGLALGGWLALAKLAMIAGWPAMAVLLTDDPEIVGVAHYRAGDYAAADAAFDAAGRTVTYNRGLSLAATGDYALSVAYFDAVIFANVADHEARRNRDLVAEMVAPVIGETDAAGRIAAAIAKIGAAEAAEAERLRVPDASRQRKPLEFGALAADGDWLNAITDDPGEFLRLRLEAEYVRRTVGGIVRPVEGSPW